MSAARSLYPLLLLAACAARDLDVHAPSLSTRGAKPPAPPAVVAIRPLGLLVEVPGDAQLEPAGGPDAYWVVSPSVPQCTVGLLREPIHAPAAPGYAELTADIRAGRNGHGKLDGFTVEQVLPDGGWRLEWSARNPLESFKDMYGVDYRVRLGGRFYACFRKADTADGQRCVVRACQTLALAR